jgi:hypothetical protein
LSKRRIARTLTQKYDMHALRILQKLETEILQQIGEVLGCDEDEVDCEIDLLRVYNSDKEKRKDELVSYSFFDFCVSHELIWFRWKCFQV